MRVKFETTDATGKVHKRGSTSRVYSHCVVIHFAAHYTLLTLGLIH